MCLSQINVWKADLNVVKRLEKLCLLTCRSWGWVLAETSEASIWRQRMKGGKSSGWNMGGSLPRPPQPSLNSLFFLFFLSNLQAGMQPVTRQLLSSWGMQVRWEHLVLLFLPQRSEMSSYRCCSWSVAENPWSPELFQTLWFIWISVNPRLFSVEKEIYF